MKFSGESVRWLDFDIETRLVGFHNGGRFKPAGCEPISIAVSWVGEETAQSVLIGQSQDIPYLLEWFVEEFYDQAGGVTGHYIRKFDLPVLNTARIEWGQKPLAPKLVHDTKCDLISFEGMSKSQENLSKTLRISRQKFHMSDADWRRSTRLTPGGKRKTRARAEKDVLQHKLMREKMIRRGLLRKPRMWRAF